MGGQVKGFRLAGVHAGIKPDGAPDLGLLVADEPATAAGVFTQNHVRAAPVVISERRLRSGRCQAVLVNSGNANACTGERGHRTAIAATRAAADALGTRTSLVVPASTGVIGVPLDAAPIEHAMPSLVEQLRTAGVDTFSRAIVTTDRYPKVAEAAFKVGRIPCRLLGVAKGAGMIHPNMATTLAFLMTDASIEDGALGRALRRATGATFNRATVDGDTSTNDSIYALASGAASNRSIRGSGSGFERFARALEEVLESLIKLIVADGEGAEHLVRIEVEGARSADEALRIARTIACSQLVKTAIHGCDPNWGRILAAAGRSGVRFDPDRTSIAIGRTAIFREGQPVITPATEARAAATMRAVEYVIAIRVGRGRGFGHYWTCDLGHEYVRINADYRT